MAHFRPAPRELTFLLDEDVQGLIDSAVWPRKRVKTLLDVDLPSGAADKDIVERAYERGLTIVTANREHFRKAIFDFQRRARSGKCSCLYGLIALPSGKATQERLLKSAGRRLRFAGRALTWKDVWRRNIEVRLPRTGEPLISTLPPPCKLRGGHVPGDVR